MNKYQEFASLVEEHNLTIKTKTEYEAMSGWTGRTVKVFDGGKEIFDLSVNGFCFEDDQVEPAIVAIKTYFEYKKLDNFDAFKKYVYGIAEEVR